MTFERFYSIIRPHKAASFNTVKRAKIYIICIVIFSVLYNIPHLFISDHENWVCLPYGREMGKFNGMVYYCLSFLVNYAVPFILLLIMNTVIIHKIRKRNKGDIGESQGHFKGKGQSSKSRNSESHVFFILLLVSFGFLLLTTPGYLMFIYIMFVDFTSSPKAFARYYLFYHIAHKLHITNHGINFFLYVISGQKFRSDLVKLFLSKYERTDNSTVASSIS